MAGYKCIVHVAITTFIIFTHNFNKQIPNVESFSLRSLSKVIIDATLKKQDSIVIQLTGNGNLDNMSRLQILEQNDQLCLIAIDEAHLIYEWYSFRPMYIK